MTSLHPFREYGRPPLPRAPRARQVARQARTPLVARNRPAPRGPRRPGLPVLPLAHRRQVCPPIEWDGPGVNGFKSPWVAFYAAVLHATDVEPLGTHSAQDWLDIKHPRTEWRARQRSKLATQYLQAQPRSSYYKPILRPCFRPYSNEHELRRLAKKLYLNGYRKAKLDLEKRICPHKGADLSTVPAVDGVITCPLHGLRFFAPTGEAIWNRP